MDVTPRSGPGTHLNAASSPRLRPAAKPAESETITTDLDHVSLDDVDLGHVDRLVAEGVFSNRSDSIRPAIRNAIERHAEVTRQSLARRSVAPGLCRADDVTPELARAAIASLAVSGCLQASPAVRRALADRLR
nr:CopG family transcriptional regulator [Methylobacterium trifolii]